MAYLKNLVDKCRDCPKRATVQLIDRWNGERGKYCSKCGARALKKQKENEEVS